MEGFKSIEDIALYTRAFTSEFDWDGFAIDTPDLYLCSKDGDVFDGSAALHNYDVTDLITQDATYVEGLVRLHKKDIALGSNDYYSYKLPDANIGGKYEPLILNLQVTEARPIPTNTIPSIESLTKIYSNSELEPLPVNILSGDYSYYANIDFITPSGNLIQSFHMNIDNSYDSGVITIDNETIYEVIDKLGPGISTIRI